MFVNIWGTLVISSKRQPIIFNTMKDTEGFLNVPHMQKYSLSFLCVDRRSTLYPKLGSHGDFGNLGMAGN